MCVWGGWPQQCRQRADEWTHHGARWLTSHAAGEVADTSGLEPGAAALLGHGGAPLAVAGGQVEQRAVLFRIVLKQTPAQADGEVGALLRAPGLRLPEVQSPGPLVRGEAARQLVSYRHLAAARSRGSGWSSLE